MKRVFFYSLLIAFVLTYPPAAFITWSWSLNGVLLGNDENFSRFVLLLWYFSIFGASLTCPVWYFGNRRGF